MNNVFSAPSVYNSISFKTINSLHCLRVITLFFNDMKKEDQNKKAQKPENEGYDINHPQNLTKPSFNSVSENRHSGNKPSIENLNEENNENNTEKPHPDAISESPAAINDDRLHGDRNNNDLSREEKDDDDDDEKLIRK